MQVGSKDIDLAFLVQKGRMILSRWDFFNLNFLYPSYSIRNVNKFNILEAKLAIFIFATNKDLRVIVSYSYSLNLLLVKLIVLLLH